jgi:hypothetical protein
MCSENLNNLNNPINENSKFAQILGILNNNFKPNLSRNFKKQNYIMHWLSQFFYMEAKFGPLEKRIKND